MTLAELIHTPSWKVIITTISVVNAIFNWPQAKKIWTERQTAGLSLLSYWMLLLVQVGFGIHGLGLGDVFVPASGAVASATTCAIIVGIYYWRAREERAK